MQTPIYFNTTPGKNDLKGALQGSVSLAQCGTMPSRASMLPQDRQPRPVALRTTLVLFRSTDGTDHAPQGLDLTVKMNKEQLFSTRMNPPQDLPRLAQRLDAGDADLTYPDSYQHVIRTQSAIEQIADDPEGTRLSTLLASYDTINVQLADHQWAEHFYLPEHKSAFKGKKIAFQSNATLGAHIHTLGGSLHLERNEQVLYVNAGGHWVNEHDVHYARIHYGTDFWSAVIPWEHLRPGISLHFRARGGGAEGSYEDVDIGAATELLLNVIDIGMLTPPREVFFEDFGEELQREYFQMTPISRLLVNQYEPVHWKEICLPDGTVHTTHSPSEGGVHSGNLRQQIGKELISLGINNANYGIHSSPGFAEAHHYAVGQVTAHTSVGNYANGRVVHGLSGGGSIVTLYDCWGNEFSHELGHNFGLSHEPGGFEGSVHRPADTINSTWGWDSDLNVFLPNFEKEVTGRKTCLGACMDPFHGHSYGLDTMAGGYPMYTATNAYTLCTPYSVREIQRYLERKAVFDPSSPTGYRKWDEATRTLQPWADFYSTTAEERDMAPLMALLNQYQLVEIYQFDTSYVYDVRLPFASEANRGKGIYVFHMANASSRLHVNGTVVMLHKGTMLRYVSNGQAWVAVEDFSFNVVRRPQEQGVPITTLLGFYDPEHEKGAYIYPALHCAYGNYHETRADEAAWSENSLRVLNDFGEVVRFALANTRGAPDRMNRFHINVPQAFRASRVEVHMGNDVVTRDIDPPRGGARFTITGRQ
ncbi:M66 family metalloprotease [Pseudomonas japonica]|uniref:StcE -like peptidase. Metallo peptidase. MEROPS family M66 n=1 Tax=Pseudomonas japonica TaxID=256466 RepID=A0A239BZK8_9PSED|nr:M66 family metalloprotease [Pseudomonas japonica]SNS12583.1 StcE -like peptidase. Metallo peptidase. MEROPS family M66 [Pseudomonas japonica]